MKREVTRVVTPGTLTDDALLDPRESNYLAAVVALAASKDAEAAEVGVAWAELSTGRFFAAVFPARQLADELARIGPDRMSGQPKTRRRCPSRWAGRWMVTTPARLGLLLRRRPRRSLTKHFGTPSLEGFGFTADGRARRPRRRRRARLPAAKRRRSSLDHLDRLIPVPRAGQFLEIDEVDAPQPGDHAHPARRPPRRLAAGGDRPHGHRHGIPAAGRLAGRVR